MKIVNIPIRPNCSGNNSRASTMPTINWTPRSSTDSRKLHQRALIVFCLRPCAIFKSCAILIVYPNHNEVFPTAPSNYLVLSRFRHCIQIISNKNGFKTFADFSLQIFVETNPLKGQINSLQKVNVTLIIFEFFFSHSQILSTAPPETFNETAEF